MSTRRLYKSISDVSPFIKGNIYEITPMDNKTLWSIKGEFQANQEILIMKKQFWKKHLIHNS